CTVQPLTSIDNLTPPVVAPTDLTTANCGALTDVPVPLKHKRNGKLGPGKLKLKMVAVSSGKPKKDPDKLMLTCLPGQTVTTTTQPQAACTPLPANTTSSCPTNAAGG